MTTSTRRGNCYIVDFWNRHFCVQFLWVKFICKIKNRHRLWYLNNFYYSTTTNVLRNKCLRCIGILLFPPVIFVFYIPLMIFFLGGGIADSNYHAFQTTTQYISLEDHISSVKLKRLIWGFLSTESKFKKPIESESS